MGQKPTANGQDEFIPTRHSLLSRLKDWNDDDSWKEFFDTYWKLIYRTGLRAGLTDMEAQDVVQETILSVAKAMPAFQYDPGIGSFKAWLQQLTQWRIGDQMRKRRPDQGQGNPRAAETVRTSTVERIADPATPESERLWNKEWERNLMDAAVERVKRRVDPKQFQIFDLCTIQKWPVNKIADTLQINRGRVYMAKHRVAALIKKEVAYLKSRTE